MANCIDRMSDLLRLAAIRAAGPALAAVSGTDDAGRVTAGGGARQAWEFIVTAAGDWLSLLSEFD